MQKAHVFSFFRAGGFDQVRFVSGADLVNLERLDQKLWIALACPAQGLAFDSRTLELIDSDKDGRIRAPELMAAVKWATGLLKNADELLKSPAELALSAIDDSGDEGRQVLQAARTVLAGLGKGSATAISVSDAILATKAFDEMPFNGDGIITRLSAADDATKRLIDEIIECEGGLVDRSSLVGIDADKAQIFFRHVAEHVAWLGLGKDQPALSPVGADTASAFDALAAVRSKLDDYFARCRLAAFDERATGALNREEKEYLAIAALDLTITNAEIRAFPLSRIAGGRALPLDEGLNPAWAEAIAVFSERTVKPLLGEKSTLTEAEWLGLKNRFSTWEEWQAQKTGATVERLGPERLKALADESTALAALFEEERRQAPVALAIASVEKLVRYSRNLFQLLNNFVSFRDFYERRTPAVFQVGTLYLDQRECQLCIRVQDPGKHAAMSSLSRAYLAYCDCTRPASGEKMSIVAAFTAGDSDNLMVGRNGIFYDNDGKDWDATITKLVDNPISIRQAFWSPYKKLIRFVEEQVAKRAGAGEAQSSELLIGGAKKVDKAVETGKAEPALPKKLDIGVVAALGVAVGGITAALGALLQAFFGLGLWMPLGVVGLILLISGPSMIIAWLKLRQRNIGPLLEANGWAVNSKALLNVPFGGSLTKTATLPKGARLNAVDPFAEKRRPWRLYILLAAVLGLAFAWYLGKLDQVLPTTLRSATVLGSNAPTFLKPTAAP